MYWWKLLHWRRLVVGVNKMEGRQEVETVGKVTIKEGERIED